MFERQKQFCRHGVRAERSRETLPIENIIIKSGEELARLLYLGKLEKIGARGEHGSQDYRLPFR